MNEKQMECLIQGASEINLALDAEAVQRFTLFAALLEDWNGRVNLTRVPVDQYVTRHFLDSLMVTRCTNLSTVSSLIDVGTGAGLPGIPLAICFPQLKITLLDSLKKRLTFLDTVISELGLKHVRTIHGRAEDLGHDKNHRGRYQVATARAVAALDILAEYLLPLCTLNGVAIALKAPDLDQEVAAARKQIDFLGGKIQKDIIENVPQDDRQIRLVMIQKVSQTPSNCPRTLQKMKMR